MIGVIEDMLANVVMRCREDMDRGAFGVVYGEVYRIVVDAL
jgi:hypothetical protein